MDLNNRAAEAANDEKLKNMLIDEYRGFILSCACKTLKRRVTDSDDEYITAMLAFNEAVDGYDKSRGSFLSFASMLIRNRLIDELRKNARRHEVAFSALENDDGMPFDVTTEDRNDIKWEIEALTDELSDFDISFFELASVSPKSRKTKRVCMDAVRLIKDNGALLDAVMTKRILPIKELESMSLNRKTLERHRKYIIAAVIIMTQDYPEIAGYFNIKEV